MMLDENSMNELLFEDSSVDNITTDNSITENTVQDSNVVTLETLHNDLSMIICFLTIGSVVIFILILYKLFNMFF